MTTEARTALADEPKRSAWASLAIHAGLCAASIVMLYPLLWMLSSSFKDEQDIFSHGLSLWPTHLNFDAYRRGWGGLTVGFDVFFWNSPSSAT